MPARQQSAQLPQKGLSAPPPFVCASPLRTDPQGPPYPSSQEATTATAPKPPIMMHRFSRVVLPDWSRPDASGGWWLAGRYFSTSDVWASGGIRLAAGLLSWMLMFRLSLMQPA